MNPKQIYLSGCVFAFLGVVLGAFAAHGLKQKLDAYSMSVFEVGVRYQMYHAFALLVLSLIVSKFGGANAGWFFVAGIIVFSGSLYLLAVTGVKKWGMITPLGGLLFLAGWLILIISALKAKP